jgi:hypothetical protein
MATTNALARDAEIVNALAPESSNSNPYIDSLISKATQEYPFISQHKPVVFTGTGPGYAEIWPAGEGGPPDAQGNDTRPNNVPIDKFGIEVRRPDAFTHYDLAGEVLHIDPYAREISDKLAKTLSPEQIKTLQTQALDYQASLDEGQSPERALQNGTDSAVRGYVVNQWPEQLNTNMGYQPVQKALLESLKSYAKTGKKP